MPELLQVLASRVQYRGAKAELAKHCGVRPMTVSDWLANPPRRYPDGERTLAILEWLKIKK